MFGLFCEKSGFVFNIGTGQNFENAMYHILRYDYQDSGTYINICIKSCRCSDDSLIKQSYYLRPP